MRTEARESKILLFTLMLCVACATASCGPAGFWKSYQRTWIIDSSSDQGPWGGTRWVQWDAEKPGAFGPPGVVSFAEKNGWRCGEPREATAAELSAWVMSGKPIFPLVYGKDSLSSLELPRHIDADSILIRCETGWIRVDPGTNAETPAYGYILIQRDGSRMAVYHHWGEG